MTTADSLSLPIEAKQGSVIVATLSTPRGIGLPDGTFKYLLTVDDSERALTITKEENERFSRLGAIPGSKVMITALQQGNKATTVIALAETPQPLPEVRKQAAEEMEKLVNTIEAMQATITSLSERLKELEEKVAGIPIGLGLLKRIENGFRATSLAEDKWLEVAKKCNPKLKHLEELTHEEGLALFDLIVRVHKGLTAWDD